MSEKDWDVYRDEAGEPVTITRQQLHAIYHAIAVKQELDADVGNPDMYNERGLLESPLLRRMLREGLPPLQGSSDVYRDGDNNPVTITSQQVRAIKHAIDVKKQLDQLYGNSTRYTQFDLTKSRLLGRMLLDGRPPLDERPGMYLGAQDYSSVESDLTHFYLDGGGPFIAILQSPQQAD